LIRAIAKFIQALNGNAKGSQIAAGISWGLLLALVPAGNFFWIVLFLISFFFRHNHGAKLLSMGLIKLASPLIIYRIDEFGMFILRDIEALQPLFTTLYNMPFVPFTRFNNTLVMGGLAGGLLLWVPVFFLFFFLIPLYRNHAAPVIRNSKMVKIIVKFPLLSFIDKAMKK
jgi:uncharacterized protein (TIGR03546 family)